MIFKQRNVGFRNKNWHINDIITKGAESARTDIYEVSMRYLKHTSCSEMLLYKGVSSDYMRL